MAFESSALFLTTTLTLQIRFFGTFFSVENLRRPGCGLFRFFAFHSGNICNVLLHARRALTLHAVRYVAVI